MNFIHVYTFLVHSGTFYWKNLFQTLIMSMRKTILAPEQLLRSVHMEKIKLPRQGGLPGVVQRVIRLSKLPRGNEKLM